MSRFRLGFDAKRLFHNRTGLGNYSRNLLYGLMEFSDDELYLYSPEIENSPFQDFSTNPALHPRSIDGPLSNLKRTFGFQELLDEDQIDLFHGLSNELPMTAKGSQMPYIVTIHDLIYRQFPKDFSFFDRQIYQTKTKFACNHASQIVAISEATKRDIIDYLDVDEKDVKVIYQTCNPFFQENLVTETAEDQNADYLLYVGTLNHRKNLLGIVEAMSRIPKDQRPQIKVVGTGNQGYESLVHQAIKTHQLETYIELLGMVENEKLKELYQKARATILPSYYEGFGIPIIESLFCGTPVITSQVTSLPEAAGPCAIYVDPDDFDSIAEGIEKSNDRNLLQELKDEIPAHIDRFSLKNTTKEWTELYSNIIQ